MVGNGRKLLGALLLAIGCLDLIIMTYWYITTEKWQEVNGSSLPGIYPYYLFIIGTLVCGTYLVLGNKQGTRESAPNMASQLVPPPPYEIPENQRSMFCPHCGKPSEGQFCKYCGAKVS